MAEEQTPEPPSNPALETVAEQMPDALVRAFSGAPSVLQQMVYGEGGEPSEIPWDELGPRLQQLLPLFMAGTIQATNEVMRLRRIVARLEADAAAGPCKGAH